MREAPRLRAEGQSTNHSWAVNDRRPCLCACAWLLFFFNQKYNKERPPKFKAAAPWFRVFTQSWPGLATDRFRSTLVGHSSHSGPNMAAWNDPFAHLKKGTYYVGQECRWVGVLPNGTNLETICSSSHHFKHKNWNKSVKMAVLEVNCVVKIPASHAHFTF